MSHPTAEEFLKDVATHEMTVLLDSGPHRHLRFKRPGTMCMHFDVVTWPGYLAISGDMGCYVFWRLDDMFEFFRSDRGLYINPGYWSQKVEARDRSGVTEFNESTFDARIKERLVEWIRDHRDSTTREDRRDLWDAVEEQVIRADGDAQGMRKQIAAHEFCHYVNEEVDEFGFRDLWESNFESYTYRYLWACYAIVWGIQQYDAASDAAAKAAA